jgi:hypothetical protein
MTTDRLPGDLRCSTDPGAQSFKILAEDLRQALHGLKPAFPKRGKVPATLLTIHVTPAKVRFVLAGAEISKPAAASYAFTAEIPLQHLRLIAKEEYRKGASITFEIGTGFLRVNNITTNSPEIIVCGPAAMPSSAESDPGYPDRPDNLDAAVGFPLLTAYAFTRKRGTKKLDTDNRQSVEDQLMVDSILKRAAKTLRPLGLTREDIEALLDRKLAIHPPQVTYPTQS